jgi:hypothetical protein
VLLGQKRRKQKSQVAGMKRAKRAGEIVLQEKSYRFWVSFPSFNNWIKRFVLGRAPDKNAGEAQLRSGRKVS